MANIQKIIEDIRENRCILFLGPLMSWADLPAGRERSLNTMFSDDLVQKLQGTGLLGRPRAAARNLYYLRSKYIKHLGGRSKFETEFTNVKEQFFHPLPALYKKLAKLPFNTIVNFGSDDLINRALYSSYYEFYPAYYNYQGDRQDILPDLDEKIQLVYNLLGSVDDAGSLVLTESDLIEYFKQIVGDRKLPNNLITRIQEDKNGPKSYLFLGFNFQDWPFRFLLDILQVPKSATSAAPKTNGYNIALITEDYYAERFGIEFLAENPETFTDLLTTAYEKSNNGLAHTKGYLCYHDSDEEIVELFKTQLEQSRLNKRIKFWDKKKLELGDHEADVIKTNFDAATIFLPFINQRFLNDENLSAQLKNMIAKSPDNLIFPVITRTCQFNYEYPELIARSKLILPGKQEVLAHGSKPVSPDQMEIILKKINAAIR